jgi:hypothetical protein
MTDTRAARLAEIERRIEASKIHWLTKAPEGSGQPSVFVTNVDEMRWLLDQLTLANKQAGEMAMLLRDGADALESRSLQECAGDDLANGMLYFAYPLRPQYD